MSVVVVVEIVDVLGGKGKLAVGLDVGGEGLGPGGNFTVRVSS